MTNGSLIREALDLIPKSQHEDFIKRAADETLIEHVKSDVLATKEVSDTSTTQHVLRYIETRIKTLEKIDTTQPRDVRVELKKMHEARITELQMLEQILKNGDISLEGNAIYKLKIGFDRVLKPGIESPLGFDSLRRKPAPTKLDLIKELGHDAYDEPEGTAVAGRPLVNGK